MSNLLFGYSYRHSNQGPSDITPNKPHRVHPVYLNYPWASIDPVSIQVQYLNRFCNLSPLRTGNQTMGILLSIFLQRYST